MNHSFKAMLSTFELTFGEDFWQNVIIVVSSHNGYPDDPEEQFSIERWRRGIQELFQKSAKAPFKSLVLDVKTKDPVGFRENAGLLWKLVSAMGSFECKDLTAVMTELDQNKAMVKDLQEELARVRKLAGIAVSFSC